MQTPAFPRDRRLEPEIAEDSSVKIIGLGGIGGIVARYLAIFMASLQRSMRLVLIDGDNFEPSNASRMFFGSCGNKAAVTRDELLPRFGDSHLSLETVEEFVTAENIRRLIHAEDIVILTVDNHATRKLVNDYCSGELDGVCLISGGNDGVEDDPSNGSILRGTYGNVQVYLRRDGRDVTPNLGQYHPEIAAPADRPPDQESCAELVISVPQILFTNLAVASAILNAFWLHAAGALHYDEVALDIADGLMRSFKLPPPALPKPVDAS